MELGSIAPLIRPCQAHGMLQILRFVELDVDADILRQPTGEQSSSLQRGEVSRVRCPGLERLHVRIHGRLEQQSNQVREVVGTEGGTKALLAVATNPAMTAGRCRSPGRGTIAARRP